MRQVKILEQKNWKGFSRHAKLTEKFDFLKKSLQEDCQAFGHILQPWGSFSISY